MTPALKIERRSNVGSGMLLPMLLLLLLQSTAADEFLKFTVTPGKSYGVSIRLYMCSKSRQSQSRGYQNYVSRRQVSANSSLKLPCYAHGDPAVSMSWTVENQGDEAANEVRVGGIKNDLFIERVANPATYVCHAENGKGWWIRAFVDVRIIGTIRLRANVSV